MISQNLVLCPFLALGLFTSSSQAGLNFSVENATNQDSYKHYSRQLRPELKQYEESVYLDDFSIRVVLDKPQKGEWVQENLPKIPKISVPAYRGVSAPQVLSTDASASSRHITAYITATRHQPKTPKVKTSTEQFLGEQTETALETFKTFIGAVSFDLGEEKTLQNILVKFKGIKDDREEKPIIEIEINEDQIMRTHHTFKRCLTEREKGKLRELQDESKDLSQRLKLLAEI